jgi:hypothetical protein
MVASTSVRRRGSIAAAPLVGSPMAPLEEVRSSSKAVVPGLDIAGLLWLGALEQASLAAKLAHLGGDAAPTHQIG